MLVDNVDKPVNTMFYTKSLVDSYIVYIIRESGLNASFKKD